MQPIETSLNKKNLQILVETMIRCGGNCSGCAMASSERMLKASIDFDNFDRKISMVQEILQNTDITTLESITIFLGQGDHFMMEDSDIDIFMQKCATMVPAQYRHKTVVFISASAIGKEKDIRHKMDLFYSHSLAYELPFFIQTVFDPKKMHINDKFRDIYINNILYFKQKCGMTEVTINIGEDLINEMTPENFHLWAKQYQFKHIEMNWVLNQQTHSMWKSLYNDMHTWLQAWLSIHAADPCYEINFVPFMSRALLKKDIPLLQLKEEIIASLEENIYIDYHSNIMVGQMGIISNLTPFGERQAFSEKRNTIEFAPLKKENVISIIRKKALQQEQIISRSLLKRPSCLACEYKSVCALSSSVSWFNYDDGQNNKNACPWNIKTLLNFLNHNFQHTTAFDKNPVQNLEIKKENNENFVYFVNKFNKKCDSNCDTNNMFPLTLNDGDI